jgi:hypothetical protein
MPVPVLVPVERRFPSISVDLANLIGSMSGILHGWPTGTDGRDRSAYEMPAASVPATIAIAPEGHSRTCGARETPCEADGCAAPRRDDAAHAWRPAALLTLDAATVGGSTNSSPRSSICIRSFFDSRWQLGGIDN